MLPFFICFLAGFTSCEIELWCQPSLFSFTCYCYIYLQVDSKQQLDTVSKFQLYEYQFAEGVSCDQVQGEPGRRRVGLLAQEVRNLIPEAVKETVRIQKHNSNYNVIPLLCNRFQPFSLAIGV